MYGRLTGDREMLETQEVYQLELYVEQFRLRLYSDAYCIIENTGSGDVTRIPIRWMETVFAGQKAEKLAFTPISSLPSWVQNERFLDKFSLASLRFTK